ncbi:MAG: RNase P modulator RnpM [Chloroflexota bacterium]
MAQRHIPERTCAACRTQRPKRELVRVVRTAENAVVVDPTGKQSGRGTYLCHDARCWDTALRRNALASALKTELRTEDREALRIYAESFIAEVSGKHTGGEHP